MQILTQALVVTYLHKTLLPLLYIYIYTLQKTFEFLRQANAFTLRVLRVLMKG